MKKPKVILVMAMTADGFITKHTDGIVNWTSKEDKQHFSQVTKDAGALIYGNATFKTFNKPLPGRLNIVMTRTPEVSKNIEGTLEYTNQEPQQILENLAQRGYETVALGGGSEINKLFLEQNLVHELMITIEPKLFGSGKCILSETQVDKSLELLDIIRINENSVVLHYKVL